MRGLALARAGLIDPAGPLCYLHPVAKSTSKRVKEELKQPDEFVSFWTKAAAQASEFAKARKRALIIGGSMLATVVAGSLVFSALAESRAQKATEALSLIEK